MKKEERYQIIIDYLEGRLNEKEESHLKAWIDSNPKHLEEINQIKTIWESDEPVNAQEIEQALLKTKLKIHKYEHQKIKTRRLYRWLRNTAAVLLLAGAGFFTITQINQEKYLTKTTTGNIDSLILKDGSMIYLSSNTKLLYPKKMNQKTRTVTLLNGEAFFKIQKDSLRPFIVNLNESKITVLGTSFNIRNNPRNVDISVSTGRVSFETHYGNETKFLTAGMGLSYNVSSNTILSFSTTNQNNTYWLNKELNFVDASLVEVFKALENCYNIKFKIAKQIKTKQKFNAEFKNSGLNEVLEVIKATYPIHFKKTEDKIIIVENK